MNAPETRVQPRQDWLAILALTALATAFDLTKAAHMDDGAHLAIAQAILAHPLHPMSALLNWDQVAEPIYALNQPHLFFYLMAGVMALTHGSDLALHLLTAVFTGATLFFFHRLAQLLAPRRALLATALLALGPAFLPSTNLMVDVPVLALWMGFFLCMARASRSDTEGAYWQACGFAAAACLVKYNSLLLLPTFVVLVARRRAFRALWALAIPAAALAAWSAFNWFDYGGIHLLGRRLGSGAPGEGPLTVLGLIAGRFPLWFVGLGATAPFAPLFAIRFCRAGACRRAALVCCAVAAAIAIAGLATPLPDLPIFRGLQPMDALLRGVFFGNGLLIAFLTIHSLKQRAEDAPLAQERADLDVLVAALAAGFATAVVLAPFPAIRHVLLSIPAILLITLRAPALSRGRVLAGATLAATALIGVAVAAGDIERAEVYRREAPLLGHAALGQSVWYVGHWGWGIYAARSGMREYEPGKSILAEGDALVEPESVHRQAITAADRSKLVLEREEEVPSSALSWVRTVTRAGGFYYFWGAVPWTFRTGPLERFRIYSVGKPLLAGHGGPEL